MLKASTAISIIIFRVDPPSFAWSRWSWREALKKNNEDCEDRDDCEGDEGYEGEKRSRKKPV